MVKCLIRLYPTSDPFIPHSTLTTVGEKEGSEETSHALNTTCRRRGIGTSLRLRVDICQLSVGSPPSFVFMLSGEVFRVFSLKESTAFVSWMRRCTSNDHLNSCPLYPNEGQHPNPTTCSYVSPLDQKDYFCYDSSRVLYYMVLDDFRFSPQETRDIISTILHHEFVRPL